MKIDFVRVVESSKIPLLGVKINAAIKEMKRNNPPHKCVGIKITSIEIPPESNNSIYPTTQSIKHTAMLYYEVDEVKDEVKISVEDNHIKDDDPIFYNESPIEILGQIPYGDGSWRVYYTISGNRHEFKYNGKKRGTEHLTATIRIHHPFL